MKKTAERLKSMPQPITSPSCQGCERGVPVPQLLKVQPSSPCQAWLTGSHPGILLLE